MRHKRTLLMSAIALVVLAAAAYAVYAVSNHGKVDKLRGLFTNESYITGLYTNLNLDEPYDVFDHVFALIEDDVTVYPSENYYYVEFAARGHWMGGTILLAISELDSGIIHFGYAVKAEDRISQGPKSQGGSHSFGKSDGLELKRISDFEYHATYKGRTVRFHFYDAGPLKPDTTRFLRSEKVLAQNFDESGMRFLLVFNTVERQLYWVLNEDRFVPDEFERVKDFKHVLVGKRTEFAFFDDTAHRRKVLIGVHGMNVLHNNWFDGPFDQMPDNYVHAGRVEVAKYLKEHYRLPDKAINKYGVFASSGGASRIPVAPYTVYWNRKQLSFVDSCVALPMTPDKLMVTLTKQVYSVPKDFQYLK